VLIDGSGRSNRTDEKKKTDVAFIVFPLRLKEAEKSKLSSG
jgi:hypothetical protein